MDEQTPKRGRGRPRLSEEEKERRKNDPERQQRAAERSAERKKELTEKQKEAERLHKAQAADRRRQNEAEQRQLTNECRAVRQSVTLTPKQQESEALTIEHNRQFLQHSLEIARLPQVDWYDVASVQNRAATYFDICYNNGMRPTCAGLALAYGVSRQELWNIRSRLKRATIPQECVNVIEKAVGVINAEMEDLMTSSKIHPVSGIFLMKNNLGYVDKQESVLTVRAEMSTPEKLIAEAKELPDVDDAEVIDVTDIDD